MSAKVIRVVEVKTTRGDGTINDRCRVLTEYYSEDGELLAASDPCAPVYYSNWESGHRTVGWLVDASDNIIRRDIDE